METLLIPAHYEETARLFMTHTHTHTHYMHLCYACIYCWLTETAFLKLTHAVKDLICRNGGFGCVWAPRSEHRMRLHTDRIIRCTRSQYSSGCLSDGRLMTEHRLALSTHTHTHVCCRTAEVCISVTGPSEHWLYCLRWSRSHDSNGKISSYCAFTGFMDWETTYCDWKSLK